MNQLSQLLPYLEPFKTCWVHRMFPRFFTRQDKNHREILQQRDLPFKQPKLLVVDGHVAKFWCFLSNTSTLINKQGSMTGLPGRTLQDRHCLLPPAISWEKWQTVVNLSVVTRWLRGSSMSETPSDDVTTGGFRDSANAAAGCRKSMFFYVSV